LTATPACPTPKKTNEKPEDSRHPRYFQVIKGTGGGEENNQTSTIDGKGKPRQECARKGRKSIWSVTEGEEDDNNGPMEVTLPRAGRDKKKPGVRKMRKA